jgi:glycerate kinase
MTDTPKVTIDGKEYTLESLSEAAKGQLTNLRVVDQEIARLQQQQAIAQTARNAYAQALQAELPKES